MSQILNLLPLFQSLCDSTDVNLQTLASVYSYWELKWEGDRICTVKTAYNFHCKDSLLIEVFIPRSLPYSSEILIKGHLHKDHVKNLKVKQQLQYT